MSNIKKNKSKHHIGILSTARSITYEELMPAIQWIEQQGYTYEIGATIGISEHQFAGTIRQRADDLQRMLNNPEIDSIWCARGGYGTVQILDHIDFSPLQTHHKWIVGYSDVTALHAHLHTLGIPSIHATMPVNLSTNSPEALQSLQHIFDHIPNAYHWTDPRHVHQAQHIEGTLIGGNLSVLYSLLGSPSAIDTAGKIVFVEDLDEYLYHIDRMLRNLDRNGLLAPLKALIVGSFTQMHDNSVPFGKDAYQILADIAGHYGYPIIYGAPLGHIADNRAYMTGQRATLKLQNNQIEFWQDALSTQEDTP
ncbi:MAG: LD-carboxypeptidase [Capnocytophaga sp.]|nr:LD-carboxypeptidase [Capnocytophaga sp.]